MTVIQATETLSGAPQFGCWSGIGSLDALAIAMAKRFDWYCVDLQHGMWEADDIDGAVVLARATQSELFVRVPTNRYEIIGRVLDMGVSNIVVPMIETEHEALEAAAASQYAPSGRRSYGPIRKVLDGEPINTAMANETVKCFVMIETVLGLSHATSIVSTPGIAGVIVGPSDLALSHGYLGSETVSDTASGAIQSIVDACNEHGKVAGIVCEPRNAPYWADHGVSLLAIANDVAALSEGLVNQRAIAMGKQSGDIRAGTSGVEL